MPEAKSTTDHLLDLFVYGPLGFALEAEQLLPKLVERGRATLGPQVGTARVLGQVVVAQGRRELDKRIDQLRGSGACRSTGAPAPTTPPAPTTAAAPATVDAAPAAVAVVAAEADDAALEEQELVADAAAGAPRHDAGEAAGLAVPDYDSLAASQVVPRLAGLSAAELEAVRRYEAAHRARRTILTRVGQLQAGR